MLSNKQTVVNRSYCWYHGDLKFWSDKGGREEIKQSFTEQRCWDWTGLRPEQSRPNRRFYVHVTKAPLKLTLNGVKCQSNSLEVSKGAGTGQGWKDNTLARRTNHHLISFIFQICCQSSWQISYLRPEQSRLTAGSSGPVSPPDKLAIAGTSWERFVQSI